MRANRRGCADGLSHACRNVRADYWNRDKPNYLFGNIALVKRMGGGGTVFLGDSTTDHVCATFALASLVAGRIRENARCRRQLERHNQQCQDDCEQDRCCLPHELRTSTRKATRREKPVGAASRQSFLRMPQN